MPYRIWNISFSDFAAPLPASWRLRRYITWILLLLQMARLAGKRGGCARVSREEYRSLDGPPESSETRCADLLRHRPVSMPCGKNGPLFVTSCVLGLQGLLWLR